jgi:hypothetical protein
MNQTERFFGRVNNVVDSTSYVAAKAYGVIWQYFFIVVIFFTLMYFHTKSQEEAIAQERAKPQVQRPIESGPPVVAEQDSAALAMAPAPSPACSHAQCAGQRMVNRAAQYTNPTPAQPQR